MKRFLILSLTVLLALISSSSAASVPPRPAEPSASELPGYEEGEGRPWLPERESESLAIPGDYDYTGCTIIRPTLTVSGNTYTAGGSTSCNWPGHTVAVTVNVVFYVDGYNEGEATMVCNMQNLGTCYAPEITRTTAGNVCSRTLVSYREQWGAGDFVQRSASTGNSCRL